GMKALHEAGRRIPEDVAVIGYDDIERARWADPPLSSCSYPGYEMGFVGTRELHEHLLAGSPIPAEIAIPARMSTRTSCGLEHIPGTSLPLAKGWTRPTEIRRLLISSMLKYAPFLARKQAE